MLLLGVPFVPFVLAFGGGPKSQGDELIVRTSRFLAAPERKQKEVRVRNGFHKLQYQSRAKNDDCNLCHLPYSSFYLFVNKKKNLLQLNKYLRAMFHTKKFSRDHPRTEMNFEIVDSSIQLPKFIFLSRFSYFMSPILNANPIIANKIDKIGRFEEASAWETKSFWFRQFEICAITAA